MCDKKIKNPVFALDIGTRSIVGVVGELVSDKVKVLAVEVAEHGGRTMVDGQIDNIRQVSELARTVTERLETKLGVSLDQVCVAAAGRALQTQKGTFTLDLPSEQTVDDEMIARLEAGAVSNAEEALQAGDADWKQLFLVGYTVAQYRLDNYPLTVLQGHKGKSLSVDVVATFLPGEVVESLYTSMNGAGLQVKSVTLEPIAAMNAAIPAELRLLNLVLVDIGAGTTDIAICRAGSVVGYTMATIAGDEITEAIMQAYLVDFETAEDMKRGIQEGKQISYRDILGLENETSAEELLAAIQEPMDRLADAIAKQIMEVNGQLPSAVFLAGGGSKLYGMRAKVAEKLGMNERHVAITGSNFKRTAFSEDIDLDNPEYTTPLGIVVSVGLNLLNDSYFIILNGQPAKLFRSGVLNVRDVLLMNGYTYSDMIGKSGKNLLLTLDGQRVVLRGEPAVPAILTVNDQEATINTIVNAGDHIDFVPARHGKDAHSSLGDFLTKQLSLQGQVIGRVLVNNEEAQLDRELANQDVIFVTDLAPQREAVVKSEAPKVSFAEKPKGTPLEVLLNGEQLVLIPKEDGQPYYLMDLLQYSGIDFEHLDRSVSLQVNGVDSGFQQVIQTGDHVEIRCI